MNSDFLIREADRCVKCGLCLPHCPTYRLARDEAESPRGRIALLQGWATGRLEVDEPLLTHLDNCLMCRRCESACPSSVDYSALLDGAREMLPRAVPAWLPDTLASPGRQRVAMKLTAGAAMTRMRKWFPSATIRRLLAVATVIRDLEPHTGNRLKTSYAPESGSKGVVALFTGCMGRGVDRPALDAAIRILTACGYEVEVPRSQQCCGAMHAHAGYQQTAAMHRDANVRTFANKGYDALVTVSSGCGSYLADNRELDSPVMDAGAFVQQQGGLSNFPLADIRRKIAVLTPCSLAAMRQQQLVMELLQELPGAEFFELQGMGCCGGAGLHLITRPQAGEQLVEPLISQLAASQAEIVTTTNSGCALQLRLAASKAGLGISVVHPLELVAEQLEINDA